MEQQRPLSVAELTARTKPTGYDAKRSFRTSLRIALDEFKAGQAAKNEGDVEQAFIHLTKAYTLLTEQLPTHPRYSELELHGQEAVLLRGHEVEISLNETKALVGRQILDWKLRHMNVPTTPRSRVQSESAIRQGNDQLKVSDSSAHEPPSPSRSAPLLSVPSTKNPPGGRHRRTSSDVGRSTSRGTTKEGSSRNRSQSPTSRVQVPSNHTQPSKSYPNGALDLSGLDIEHDSPMPRIVIRQPTTITQQLDGNPPLDPTQTLEGLVSSASDGESPSVPSLILTDLSREQSPSQVTLEEPASIITPGDAVVFPTVQDYDLTNKPTTSTSADKPRPRTLSDQPMSYNRPLVDDPKEMSYDQPPQRPGSCPPTAINEATTNERETRNTTTPAIAVPEVTSTGTSEFFTAPLVPLEGLDISSDPEHPESIAKLEEEAVSYLDSEEFERATDMLILVLNLRRHIQGENHLFTIQTMSNLGLGYEGQGRLDHAVNVLLATLRQLDRCHPAVNLRFRSPIETRLAALRQKQEKASKTMTLVRFSNVRPAVKRNNSLDQIATRVRFDGDTALHIGIDTTPEEIMAHLTNRRCPNLTDRIDTVRCSKLPVNGGGFGDIWRGALVDGRPIAMKRIYQGERKINKRLAQELYAWSKADHQNVLELLGIAYYKDYLVMISPWMSYGSIHDYLEQYPDSNRLHMAIQVADGIAHLHAIGMVHGDLKAQNVFVSQDGILKVGDFGLAVMLGERSVAFQPSTLGVNASAPGSMRWMAPELFRPGANVSLESDIYSLGMTIYEIISHRLPFWEMHHFAVPAAVCNEKLIPSFPYEIQIMGRHGTILWDLLRRCWNYNPTKRPTANQVLREMHKVASH